MYSSIETVEYIIAYKGRVTKRWKKISINKKTDLEAELAFLTWILPTSHSNKEQIKLLKKSIKNEMKGEKLVKKTVTVEDITPQTPNPE